MFWTASRMRRARCPFWSPCSEGGFGIMAALDVHLPGLTEAEATKLVETTHRICPYANAIKASVDLKTSTRA